MRDNRRAGSSLGSRAAAVAAVAVAAAGFFAPGAANADTFVKLADGHKAGPGATITRTNESALVSSSMAANGAGRVVWVSGTVVADVTATPEGDAAEHVGPRNRPGTNNSSTHGASQLNHGYIVGCQVSIGDNAISAGASGGMSTSGVNVGGSVGLNIGPGEVKWVGVERADIEKPGVYTIQYQDMAISIEGCAGYAQARSYTNIEIIGAHYSKTTLYGQPFSIG